MQESAPSDAELLTDWLTRQREPAFHALVARYANLVHMAARRTCRDETLAAEASQLTFILLARKAKSLTTRTSLAGWLHLTAVMQSKNLLRKSHREAHKRQLLHADMERQSTSHAGTRWQEIQPILDDALASLPEADREALLLHFYRSLTVREIAAILGIATDTARKRIDRATEKLRLKLARRGCHLGGSLAAAMIAGFAADSQAAVPAASLLASNALAAASPLSIPFLITAMKITSLAAPVLALLIAGFWIGSKREAIAKIEKQTSVLESAVARNEALATSKNSGAESAIAAAKGKSRLNWQELIDRFDENERIGMNVDMGLNRFSQQVDSFSAQELLDSLSHMNNLQMSGGTRDHLERGIVRRIIDKHPDFALTHLINRFDISSVRFFLPKLLGTIARSDMPKAIAWLDEQTAVGSLDILDQDSKKPIRLNFEAALIKGIYGSNPETAAQRLAAFPKAERADLLNQMPYDSFDEKEQLAFAKLVRDQVPAEDQTMALANHAGRAGDSYKEVQQYMDRIQATPAEREACVEKVVTAKIGSDSINYGITLTDLDKMREWVGSQAPDLVDRLTGEALARGARWNQKQTFTQIAELAIHYDQENQNDGILSILLQSEAAEMNQAEAREVAKKISDPQLRTQILKTLE